MKKEAENLGRFYVSWSKSEYLKFTIIEKFIKWI